MNFDRNLKWHIDFEVDEVYNCEADNCYIEGICRCSRITGVSLIERTPYSSLYKIIDAMSDSSDTTFDKWFWYHFIKGFGDIELSFSASNDYYGEVLDYVGLEISSSLSNTYYNYFINKTDFERLLYLCEHRKMCYEDIHNFSEVKVVEILQEEMIIPSNLCYIYDEYVEDGYPICICKEVDGKYKLIGGDETYLNSYYYPTQRRKILLVS